MDSMKKKMQEMKLNAALVSPPWMKGKTHAKRGRTRKGSAQKNTSDSNAHREEEKQEQSALEKIWERSGARMASPSYEDVKPLDGGVAIDASYDGVHGRSLCQSIFESFDESESLLPRAYEGLKRTNVNIGAWECDEDAGTCTRQVSYTSPPSGSVKTDYDSFETQTIQSPAPGVCLIDALVSTPTVRFGTTFKVRADTHIHTRSCVEACIHHGASVSLILVFHIVSACVRVCVSPSSMNFVLPMDTVRAHSCVYVCVCVCVISLQTSVRYIIERPDGEERIEDTTAFTPARTAPGTRTGDRMNVSFDVVWTGRKPLLAAPIKRAIKRAVYRNFGIFTSQFPGAG